MRVLLVDDEPDILEQAEIFLQKEVEGLGVETVPSAEEALDRLEENDYDAVVSDYQMPGMDGLDFLETLREERQDGIPFIIFTGKGREAVAMEALNLGADRYLQKGGSPKSQYGVLAQAIVQEVEHRRTRKRARTSARDLKETFNALREATMLLDDEHRILMANRETSRLFGMPKDDVVGEKCHELAHGTDTPIENCPLERTLELKEVEQLEFYDPAHDKHFMARTYPILDGDGNVEKVVHQEIDITGIKVREEKLKQYMMAVEGSNDLMAACDENYNYLFANEAYLEYYQLDRDEITDLTLEQVIGEQIFANSVKLHVDECLEGQTVEYEMVRDFPGKSKRKLSVSYYPLRDSDDEIKGMVAVLRDVTERNNTR